GLPWAELAALLPPAPPPGGRGSNAWVVAGGRTGSGAPLLANDPHLGLQAPGVWYLAHLRAPGLNAIGATLPGVPGVVLGRNDRIAWGFTNGEADTQDLFVERLDPADPDRYLTPDGPVPFGRREEVIRIKGAEEPVRLTVRTTRHGPVLSDLLPPPATGSFGGDRVLALAWPALAEDDRTFQAGLGLAAARDWEGFVLALRDFGAPPQNVVYADVDGRIGFYTAGRVPVRAAGDGTMPVPGWSGAYDWEGVIPFDDLPHAVDPADGAFVNANNRPVGPDYPYLLSADWPPAYRARRIEELLAARGDHGLADFRRMQGDLLSMLARDLLPLMLAAEPEGDDARAAMARLAAWDGMMAADRPEPLLFAAWYRALAPALYADELGPLFDAYRGLRAQFLRRVLTERAVWCDDVTTPARESCPEVMGLALERALAELRERHGTDADGWRWGEPHAARMVHPLFGDRPPLDRLFNIERPVGGDSTTVNVGHYVAADPVRPFAVVFAPSYRGLYDLADPDRSRFVPATGQSGNPLSPHYADLTALWTAGGDVPMTTDRAEFADRAIGVLRLEPVP
ncbi:MAG TPA: penicillin acylase family protein, partial [Geminicoccaceae bacterium]|nr:penicillin acylase family protein [Geminicoccaceae bacterium]